MERFSSVVQELNVDAPCDLIRCFIFDSPRGDELGAFAPA